MTGCGRPPAFIGTATVTVPDTRWLVNNKDPSPTVEEAEVPEPGAGSGVSGESPLPASVSPPSTRGVPTAGSVY